MLWLSKLLNKITDFISSKLGFNFKHLISFFLSKLFSNKIDENLLVFGSTNGKAFAGNCKVVFEYLTKFSNYYCVWITVSNDIHQNLRKQGYHVILNNNIIKIIKLLKAAKYIFFSHGFGDILLIDFSSKTKLVYLAHGISFKKGGYDLNPSFYPLFERKINDILVKRITYFIDSSEETKEKKISCYMADPKKFIITGYPRNDILLNYTRDFKKNIIKNLNLDKYKQIILYAPTFRDYDYTLPLNKDFLAKLNRFFENEEKIFLYKPHPFMKKIILSDYRNIKVIEPNVDINDLLIISDVLITDYSSVFYDFLLTMRPIIFFADDLEKYIEVRDFYYEYKTFVPGPYVKSGDQLLEKLKTIDKWDIEYQEKRRQTRNRFNKYIDGKATTRLIELLKLKEEHIR